MDRARYPFSAVVGQERAKQALLCLAVEPRIGGVLLCGEKGTAKSTLVRAMGGLEGVHLVELPVSTTEDMLLGGVELETAVRTGRRQFCRFCHKFCFLCRIFRHHLHSPG